MKITCQSCQSKYNVADDKVQGKIVKIRCRKCGSTIVVNAASTATNGSAETEGLERAAGPSSKPVSSEPWHVNIAEDDQRTMTVAELVDAYNAGTVTQDTFVWREGMGDWKPISEVDAIVSALEERPSETSGLSDVVAKVAPPSDVKGGLAPAFPTASSPILPGIDGPNAYEGLVASSDIAARPETKRAALKREGRGRDLFASGGDSHVGTDIRSHLETSSPLMGVGGMAAVEDPNKLTGERNENSVLFSLAVLTKTAEDRAPTAEDVATAAREDSGLIDLKALAAKTESMRPAMAVDGGIFSSPLGGMAPLGAIDAPLGDTQAKSRLPRAIALSAGLALLLILGIVIGVKMAGGSGEATAPSAAIATPPPSAQPAVTASAAASANEPPPAAPSAAPSASPAPAAAAFKPKPAGNPTAAFHSQAGTGGGKSASGGAAAPAAGPPPAAAPAKKGDCGCNGDLMCLMKCSTH